ncbi:MAG: STAS domain-containing protein [Phyllobacterium sp.]
MATSVDVGLTAQTFKLAQILDLKAAAPLAESLMQMRGSDLTIDASDVEQLGGQCLQVLLSAQATWRADESALHVSRPSPEFAESLRLLGISPMNLSTDTLPVDFVSAHFTPEGFPE